MKNYEKYADETKRWAGSHSFCDEFIEPNILKPLGRACANMSCEVCHTLRVMWLLEDYEEPETDWSKVEVDTPILVKQYKDSEWKKRYFAKYEDETVFAWNDGKTSWTTLDDRCMSFWEYAKLLETEDVE